MSPSSLPRCRTCRARIEFFGSPFTPLGIRVFEAKPVDGRTYPGVAYPVSGQRAWRFDELAETMQVSREVSRGVIEDEIRDMPWYVLHDCPNAPERTGA